MKGMIRSFFLTLLAMTSFSAAAEPEGTHWDAPSGIKVIYRFATPEKIEEGKTYPLILFLHGAGERGSDNNQQLKHGVMPILENARKLDEPLYLIAPQCPKEEWWSPLAADRLRLADAGGKNELMEAVLALVERTAEKHPIDRSRIYITGISMGGFGTWDMLTRAPDTFAAAIPICGGGDPEKAEKFKDVPIRIYHGADDQTILPEAGRMMAEALEKAGGKPEFIVLPGVAHDSWTRTYKDVEVIGWLLSKRRAG
jgi:predicted peptidase